MVFALVCVVSGGPGLGPKNLEAHIYLAALKTIFNFILGPPVPGGPGGGSGLSFSIGVRGFGADCLPDAGGNVF